MFVRKINSWSFRVIILSTLFFWGTVVSADEASFNANVAGSYEGKVTWESGETQANTAIVVDGNKLDVLVTYPEDEAHQPLIVVERDEQRRLLLLSWAIKDENGQVTDTGLTEFRFSEDYTSFEGTWGVGDSRDNGGITTGSRSSGLAEVRSTPQGDNSNFESKVVGTYEGELTWDDGQSPINTAILLQDDQLVVEITISDGQSVHSLIIAQDEGTRQLVLRTLGYNESGDAVTTGHGEIHFSEDYTSFEGTWGEGDSRDDGGTLSGTRGRSPTKQADNFYLYAMDRSEKGVRSLGSVATTDEICDLLRHKIFDHSLATYKWVYGTNDAHWEGMKVGQLWLKQVTEGYRTHYDTINLHPDTWRLGNKNFSACLRQLEKSKPRLYSIVVTYFLGGAVDASRTPRCYEQAYRIEERVDDAGNIIEEKILTENRHPCFNTSYGYNYVHNWNHATFATLLIWTDAHRILRKILDQGEEKLAAALVSMEQEKIQEAEAERQEREEALERDRKRRKHSSTEQTRPLNDQKSNDVETQDDNISLALDVLNYTFSGDKKVRETIVLDAEACIFEIDMSSFLGERFYVLHLNNVLTDTVTFSSKTYFNEMFNEYMETYIIEFSGDESVIYDSVFGSYSRTAELNIHDLSDIDRVRKAWGLLYSKACAGAAPSEF